MKKWEYKILQGGKRSALTGLSQDSEKLEQSFNELGKQAWEYVRSENIYTDGWTNQVMYIFRRELV
jgi:hypothetical protein